MPLHEAHPCGFDPGNSLRERHVSSGAPLEGGGPAIAAPNAHPRGAGGPPTSPSSRGHLGTVSWRIQAPLSRRKVSIPITNVDRGLAL